MSGVKSGRFLAIAKSNLKHNYGVHVALCLLLLLLTPIIFGINDLNAAGSAVPLELFVSLTGIILLVPLFLPEQNENIRDLVFSKKTPPLIVYGIRLLLAILLLVLMTGGMIFLMRAMACSFAVMQFWLGTLATAFFLGSLGMFVYALSGVLAIGYMAPLVYYVFHLMSGPKKLGCFYLFSLAQNNMAPKYCLLGVSVLLTAAALIIYRIRKNK